MLEPDTDATIEFHGFRLKLAGLFGMSLVGLAVCSVVLKVKNPGSFAFFVGCAGAAMCLLAAGKALHLFVNASQAVVSLSPKGLYDGRISASPIPWAAITDWTRSRSNSSVSSSSPSIRCSKRPPISHAWRVGRARPIARSAPMACAFGSGTERDPRSPASALQGLSEGRLPA